MLRGFYTAGSAMIANQRYQDSLTNNMSNSLTPGYKQDRAAFRAFPEMLIKNMETHDVPTKNGLTLPFNQTVGSINSGMYMQEDIPLFTQGDVQPTDIPTDLAIQNGNLPDETGSIFFTVQNNEGETRLTRNGNFTVDAQGYLTSSEGHYVLNQDGDRIQTGTENFEVTENGEVISPFDNTLIGIAYHPNANDLTKEGSNLYAVNEEAPVNARAEAGVGFQVLQGNLERSNVDPQQVMTEMMRSYRNFEMNQQVVRMYDQSMDLAANQVGRLR
ncbi:flagellar biosynthesis protein FlgC [Halalkalibacillus sediminis]|uniref:Flagellar biosynthesis protein FlgC n=1 Tax=Halalkalibacillus sediminis TaxID=2018042 RepID=A0A2I0QTT6_9BACI|nr:flagellar hook-basal body protein [Halalkalibacillus sediminis]PKR77765.1 flagellar biosynthesis protein FlgC [Halalkalibacillus sediminis]